MADPVVNDPQWRRFRGDQANLVCREDGAPIVTSSKSPTVGIGGYRCRTCEEIHFCLALVTTDGWEINVNVSPDVAAEILKNGVQVLGELGHSLLALKGFRALQMVTEIADTNDTEADYLDGSGLREACRLVLSNNPMTTRNLPRLYGPEDRDRAVAAIRPINAGRKSDAELREIVDLVANALGMTPAGG